MDTAMIGKVVLVTGATNGIGKVTAQELARKGAAVVIAGRDPTRTQAAAQEIAQQSGNPNIDLLVADLSSMAGVRKLAGEFLQKYPRLDVLVNNAGAYFTRRQVTVDGYELTFALNHLSYFLLTHLLLDLLKASAPSRIVNVSSGAHLGAKMTFDDLSSRSYRMFGFGPYGMSKLANVMFTYTLARRLQGSKVTANALHPGSVNTGFAKNNRGLVKPVMSLVARLSLTPEQGAETSIYLASSPEVMGVTGKYFYQCKAVSSSPASYDETAQERLWEISEQMTGLKTAAA